MQTESWFAKLPISVQQWSPFIHLWESWLYSYWC